MRSCFGKYWEGANDSTCKEGAGCERLTACLISFAKGKLLETQQLLGPKATPKDLGDHIGVSPEAVLLAINFQKNIGSTPNYPVSAVTKSDTVKKDVS